MPEVDSSLFHSLPPGFDSDPGATCTCLSTGSETRSPSGSPRDGRSFKHWIELLFLLLIIGGQGGCAKPYEPFQIPQEEFRDGVSTIAFAPTRVPSSMLSADEARETFESIAVRRLEEAGFRVLGSELYDELWRDLATGIGPVFDASTGEVNDDRYEIVREALYAALEEEHDVDAIIRLQVKSLDLYDTGSEPRFCGGHESIFFPSPAMDATSNHARARRAIKVMLVRVTCLSANVYNLDGQHLYGIRAPLEVVETYANQTRARRSKGQSLSDQNKIRHSIEQVIGQLADRGGNARAD